MKAHSSGAKEKAKKVWHFFWHDDSLGSWAANIVVAFLVIRFIVYPLLGIMLGTSFPIVAVVSESMEHGLHNNIICGKEFETFPESFDNFWDVCGSWYEAQGITKEEFEKFPLKSGFNKGDVIILWRARESNLGVGDVLIFAGNKPQPIIHRIVRVWQEDGVYYYQTKGDHNSGSIKGDLGEEKIAQSRILGKGVIRIPYFGWVKILFVELLKPFGIIIER